MHILILTTIQTRFVIYQHLVNKHILYVSLWALTHQPVLNLWLIQPLPLTKVQLQGEGLRLILGHRLVYATLSINLNVCCILYAYTYLPFVHIYRILIYLLHVYTTQIDLALLYTTIVCNMAENHIILGIYMYIYCVYVYVEYVCCMYTIMYTLACSTHFESIYIYLLYMMYTHLYYWWL